MAAANSNVSMMAGTMPIQRPPMSVQATGLPPTVTSSPQLTSPTKELNTKSLCRHGQETVQDIVVKTTETFKLLCATQLPNNVNVSTQIFQERKAKLDETIRQVAIDFKKLRLIYDKVLENTSQLDSGPVERLLPIEGKEETEDDKPKITDAARYASEEHKILVEQIQMRNHQIKEIVDQLRTIIWEINTMMAMRKS